MKFYQYDPIIIILKEPQASCDVSRESLKWFYDNFPVYCIPNIHDLETFMIENKVDVYYQNTAGFVREYWMPISVPSVIHAIFQTHSPYGTVFTTISKYLAIENNTPVLPNILLVDPTLENLRSSLNIPKDAIVYGRYGGYEQFDIPYVIDIVKEVARTNPLTYFIFMHTKPFLTEKCSNIIFLPGTRDITYKTKFINTCDAMLHARNDGETFGCACGEFALKDKPIITSKHGDLAHIDILRDKVIIYNNSQELHSILLNHSYITSFDMSDNGYYDYSPEKVMPILKRYIEEAVRKHQKHIT